MSYHQPNNHQEEVLLVVDLSVQVFPCLLSLFVTSSYCHQASISSPYLLLSFKPSYSNPPLLQTFFSESSSPNPLFKTLNLLASSIFCSYRQASLLYIAYIIILKCTYYHRNYSHQRCYAILVLKYFLSLISISIYFLLSIIPDKSECLIVRYMQGSSGGNPRVAVRDSRNNLRFKNLKQ